MLNRPAAGEIMKEHWEDEEIVAEVRRLQKEKGFSETEAGLIVLYHGILPLLEMVKGFLDIKASVAAYTESQYRVKREEREKRHKNKR